MIRIVAYRDNQSRWVGFSAAGHSGYAEEGSDIVCAAVSALTITCVNSLDALLGVTPEIEGGEDGRLKAMVTIPADTETAGRVQLLFDSLMLGLKQMAEDWPKYVKLSIQERRETP